MVLFLFTQSIMVAECYYYNYYNYYNKKKIKMRLDDSGQNNSDV